MAALEIFELSALSVQLLRDQPDKVFALLNDFYRRAAV
jgi:hypothetical protein